MTIKLKSAFLFFGILISFGSCKKAEYQLGTFVTPTNLKMSVTVIGADSINKGGDSTGRIILNVSADNALSFNVDFGDSSTNALQSFLGGTLPFKYSKSGIFDYVVSVNAIGTGGTISTISKIVHVLVNYKLDSAAMAHITNNNSKVWVTDKNASGHVGVGPASDFTPSYYSAIPNSRDACLYDDEITFEKVGKSDIFMTLDNKGVSSLINAATAYYGFAPNAGNGCYNVTTNGRQKLLFADATSASTKDISTRIQFTVPGNGLVNFGTGGSVYEILTLTDSTMELRNIGVDGLAWFQKLKTK